MLEPKETWVFEQRDKKVWLQREIDKLKISREKCGSSSLRKYLAKNIMKLQMDLVMMKEGAR